MTVDAPVGVLSLYAGIERLKSMIGVTSESHDDALWRHLHAASRAVDAWCRRQFFVTESTKHFDVGDVSGFAVPDLVAVETMREDVDGDRIYEVERETGDYLLLPVDAEPTDAIGRPYTRVLADPLGPRPRFATGHARVEITGWWGFRDHRVDTGADLAAGGPLLAGETSFTVTDGALIAAGSTAYIEEEQMFVRGVSGDTVTVARGVNGTVGVTHADGVGIDQQAPPAEVVEATLLIAARSWKRKDSPYGAVAGINSLGAVRVAAGRDPDVVDLLEPYRRIGFAASKLVVF